MVKNKSKLDWRLKWFHGRRLGNFTNEQNLFSKLGTGSLRFYKKKHTYNKMLSSFVKYGLLPREERLAHLHISDTFKKRFLMIYHHVSITAAVMIVITSILKTKHDNVSASYCADLTQCSSFASFYDLCH